jgi:hypothetical protein
LASSRPALLDFAGIVPFKKLTRLLFNRVSINVLFKVLRNEIACAKAKTAGYVVNLAGQNLSVVFFATIPAFAAIVAHKQLVMKLQELGVQLGNISFPF